MQEITSLGEFLKPFSVSKSSKEKNMNLLRMIVYSLQTSTVFLAMIVAASATFCCKPEDFGLDNIPEKASDSKTFLNPNNKPTILKSTHQVQEALAPTRPAKTNHASNSGTKSQAPSIPTLVNE